MWGSVTTAANLTCMSRGGRKPLQNTHRPPVSGNDVPHQLLVHIHLLRKIESLALQQCTPALLRSRESFRHLEGVFRLSLAVFEEVVLLRWWGTVGENAHAEERRTYAGNAP